MIFSLILIKLALGLLFLILQINLMGKGNLAPNSAMDQVQNFVLGGIIGGVIFNKDISVFEFLLVLLGWTLLILTLKYAKANSRFVKVLVDGKPVILVERGEVQMDVCMKHGILAHDLNLKLRMAGAYYLKDVKRAVLEPNGQLTVVQFGEENAHYPLILDGQLSSDILELIDKDAEWLEDKLRALRLTVADVYIGEYSDGTLLISTYDGESVRTA